MVSKKMFWKKDVKPNIFRVKKIENISLFSIFRLTSKVGGSVKISEFVELEWFVY
jgi:hypothetical protein